MSEGRKARVVIYHDFTRKKEKKVWWWSKIHPLRLFQIPVGIAIATFVIYGLYLFAEEGSHQKAILWMCAFWLMFLFWACEYHIAKDFDLYKTES